MEIAKEIEIEENVTEEINVSKVGEEEIVEEVKKEKKSKAWIWFLVVFFNCYFIDFYFNFGLSKTTGQRPVA